MVFCELARADRDELRAFQNEAVLMKFCEVAFRDANEREAFRADRAEAAHECRRHSQPRQVFFGSRIDMRRQADEFAVASILTGDPTVD